MVNKIVITEVLEHVYEPDPDDYVDEIEGEYTLEKALELDQRDVKSGKVKFEHLIQETRVISRVWKIIDEP